MKEITIKESEVGIEFLEELEKVVNIRIQRREIYGDTFLEDSFDFLLMKLEDKIKRVKLNIKNNNLNNSGVYENARDSLRDTINYSLFLLCKINKGDTYGN